MRNILTFFHICVFSMSPFILFSSAVRSIFGQIRHRFRYDVSYVILVMAGFLSSVLLPGYVDVYIACLSELG